MFDDEGLLMDNENYQKFIAELYSNETFLSWTNDMSRLAGYMAGEDIGLFRSDVANLLFRHHKRRKAERRRREFYNNMSTCFRRECDRRRETPKSSAYKDMYCSKECYKIVGLYYAIARTKNMVETGVWDEYPEKYEDWKEEQQEWINKYEVKYGGN